MNSKTKNMVVTALLAAIAIIIPLFVPVKLSIPPFSATLASHVPLILAMFISPLSAVFVGLVSALGFLFAMGPVVSARAATHVVFLIVGALMIKKGCNIYLTAFVTMILHSLSDMFIVWLLCSVVGMMQIEQTMAYMQGVIAVGTSVHHLMDFAIALLIYVPLRQQNKELFMPISWRIKK